MPNGIDCRPVTWDNTPMKKRLLVVIAVIGTGAWADFRTVVEPLPGEKWWGGILSKGW